MCRKAYHEVQLGQDPSLIMVYKFPYLNVLCNNLLCHWVLRLVCFRKLDLEAVGQDGLEIKDCCCCCCMTLVLKETQNMSFKYMEWNRVIDGKLKKLNTYIMQQTY